MKRHHIYQRKIDITEQFMGNHKDMYRLELYLNFKYIFYLSKGLKDGKPLQNLSTLSKSFLKKEYFKALGLSEQFYLGAKISKLEQLDSW